MSFERIPATTQLLSGAEWIRAFTPAAAAPRETVAQVPWRAVWREGTPAVELRNLGNEVLLMVRVFVVGARAFSTLPSRVLPGEVVTAQFPEWWGEDVAFVRWLRAGGEEYVWPIIR